MIIKYQKGINNPDDNLLYIYPDPLATKKKKESKDYIKGAVDYFYSAAVSHYAAHRESIDDNYALVKGKLRRKHFYETPEVKSFTEVLLQNEDLPSYVKHYSILTPPINTLVGEMSKMPDNVFVKDFSEDAHSDEIEYKTEILQQYIIQNAKAQIAAKLAQEGHEVSDEELEQLAFKDVEEELVSYTSQAEKWGAKVIDFLKVRLSMKEKQESGFRDLLISGREIYHIYEDNSELGFNVECLNPKNVGFLMTPDEEYLSNPMDKGEGAYASWIIRVMELSKIIQRYNLPEEEIEHLKKLPEESNLISTKESNLFNGSSGEDSITYNTYNPLILQERMLAESQLMGDEDNDGGLSDLLGVTSNNVGTFGYKYIVLEGYHVTKTKIGKLTFVDEENQEQTLVVDENYKEGSHPQEIAIEWTWVNQWYKFLKIGKDIYYYEPFELLDYCPIIGVLFENKNAPIRSLVDQMKPFQMLYNVAMNQLFRLLEKDMGVVFLMSHRHVPIPKDGSYEDAVEIWETEAREKGYIWVDDSPENLKAPSSFNQFSRVDLSRANEIQARYNLAVEMRNECWKLVGLSEQRLGEAKATETATGINTALSQSYAQTDPWFSKHGYLINKVYQALLDAALYVESNKPVSTISYITSEGENAFVQVNGSDLKFRDLGVLITNRSEDSKNFFELRQLAQAMLQNGATPYEIALLYSTKSIRYMKDTFKRLQEKAEDFQRRQQAMEEQQVQQQQEQFQQQQQLMQLQNEKQMAYTAYNDEQNRISKERIAAIQAASKDNGGTMPSTLDLSRFDNELATSQQKYNLELQKISQQQQQILLQAQGAAEDRKLQKEKLQVEREKIEGQKYVARINKNPGQSKKPKK